MSEFAPIFARCFGAVLGVGLAIVICLLLVVLMGMFIFSQADPEKKPIEAKTMPVQGQIRVKRKVGFLGLRKVKAR